MRKRNWKLSGRGREFKFKRDKSHLVKFSGTLSVSPSGFGFVKRDGEGQGEDVLVFTVAASSPEQAWRHFAGESSAWVLLANANDRDSLRATKADLEFVRGLGDVPFVVATYTSMADDELSAKQVARALGVDAEVPVLACQLRDRESVVGVLKAVLELIVR